MYSTILIVLPSCKHYVNFETTIQKENATKDGIYLDEYVVNIEYKKILILDGERVKIKGRYCIVKGLDPNDTEIKQGRVGDTKMIKHPRIKKIK